jgi:hypothetical protein
MQIRYEIAKELIQDLQLVPEDNNELLRQSLQVRDRLLLTGPVLG